MKTIFYCLVLLAICAAGYGYQYVQTHPALRYYGIGDSDTAPFMINDGWELSWVSAGSLKVELVPVGGGTPIDVAQTLGMARGISPRDKGGQYTLRIHGAMPWLVTATNGKGATPAMVDTVPVVAPEVPPSVATAAPPPTVMPAAPTPMLASVSNTPVKMADKPAPAPVVAPATDASGNLSPEVMKAVVIIKGDRAQGTGFLVKMPDGPAVVTNIHVLAANPNFKITTSGGATVEATAMKGASDRDLAVISIKDAGYSYLDVATDVSSTAQAGDEVETPGNSQGGGVMLNTSGKVLGIGPDRLEIDNPIYHGNSGGPIYHAKSGKVLGVVTEGMKVDTSNALDKASSLSRNSAIKNEIRYFGMRLDNVPQWVPVDWQRFLTETQFLIQFNQRSMELDSFLNGDSDHPEGIDPNLYRKNEQLVRANDEVVRKVHDGDAAQRIDAWRQFVFDMETVADVDVKAIAGQNNFYSFNWEQAQEERDYRQALRKEIEGIQDNVDRLNGVAHRN